jgi:peptide/nickel transport system substrate-binding protein
MAEDLVIGVGATITSIDPHFYNASPNNSIAMQVFDRLTERTASGQLVPGLAESWEATGESQWKFKLRAGVKWHDGKPLTADDVVFTVGRAADVPNSPGGFGGFIRAIDKVEAEDELTVVISTKGAAPSLPGDLANIAIVSRHAGEDATTADYNSGKAAIGTGAFRFTAFKQGDQVTLERNPDWWGHKVAWDHVSYRMIPNAGGRTAALLAGDVDMIDTPPAADIERLKSTAGISVATTPGLRVIYLAPSTFDISKQKYISAPKGEALSVNPLQDARVRKALSISINREAIVSRIMEGMATASAQWLPKGAYSYVPDLGVPQPDPAAAKALLTEAGYPEGFRVTLHVPNDRYPNAPAVAQAIAQMWTRIGVATTVESLPWTTYSANMESYAIKTLGLGNATFDASSMLINVIGTKDAKRRLGASNDSGYSNPELDKLTAEAMAISDPAVREAKLQDAVKFAIEDQAIIPLYQQSNTWGLRDSLTYEPRIDERTLAKDVMPR